MKRIAATRRPIIRGLAIAWHPAAAAWGTWLAASPGRSIVEHPDGLGYRLVADPLLEVMDAGEWYALEHAALVESRSAAV
ncbi:MAG: hypothetical protein JWQ18_3016 [Conexibacter sp.]|nr:hypothetical protein [Conexibacter sp.]